MVRIGPKSQVASIDVDAQYSFTPECPQELPIPDGQKIVAQLNHQATFAQYRIGSKEAHSPQAIWIATHTRPVMSPVDSEHADLHWPAHCIPGTKGFELIAGLPHPAQYDFFVWKGVELDMHPYGACFHDLKERLSTGIIEFLKVKQVKTVLVGGLATDYCVKNTTLQLLAAGFQVVLNLGACRGLAARTSEEATRIMQQQGATIIHSTEELSTYPSLVAERK